MNIIPISIPTPFYVGAVNIYLIKEDPLTLIDVGPKTPEALNALRDGLAREGVKIADISRVLLTHAHEDHCGLSKTIRDEAKNADIYVHPWETGHLFGRLASDLHKEIMLRAGVPKDVFSEMRADYDKVSLLTDSLSLKEYKLLNDEDEIEFDNAILRVMHTPGHTPGSCSFLRLADRTIFCGDCALKRISPNPIVAPDPINPNRRFPSLAEYLVSLARIRGISPTKVFTGHGDPIIDFESIFNRYRRDIDQRQKLIVNAVSENGSTAWEVTQILFPKAIDKEIHRFLAISESISHLDYAVQNGMLNTEQSDSMDFYLPRTLI